jgi:tetratricopeptide (TPR) repeat protein
MTVTMVGRAREVGSLRAAMDAAIGGRAGVALVGGEAGIGKTTLAAEAARHAEEIGARTLWATCFPREAGPPYWPWVQILRAYARDRDIGALVSGIGAVSEDLARLVPELLPGEARVSGAQTLDPDQERFRLLDSFATFLQKASDAQPCVVVLDDLHGADATSLALLQFLSREVRDARLLILGTYRDDEVGAEHPLARTLAGLPREATRIVLEGLSPADVGELLAAATGTKPAEDAVRAVYERTGGNPFFVSEIAALIEQRGLAGVEEIIPRGVREVIEDRLRRLSPACLEVLGAAAVAGQSSSADLLARVTNRSRDAVRAAMDEAGAARLIQEERSWAREFAFRHAIVREALNERLSPSERAHLHLQIGEAVEKSAGADPPVARLAHHFLGAGPGGAPSKAFDYARRAARQSMERFAYEEAAHLFSRALDVLEGIGAEDELRLEVILSLGEARIRAGEWPVAIEAYLAAAELARTMNRPEDLARAALGLGAGLGGFEVRLFDQRQIDLLEEAIAALPEADSGLRAWVMARLSVALSFVGSEQRRTELAREAVDMARRVGDAAATAYALSTYCDTIATPQYAQERAAATAEMVALTRGAGDRELELLARRASGSSRVYAGLIRRSNPRGPPSRSRGSRRIAGLNRTTPNRSRTPIPGRSRRTRPRWARCGGWPACHPRCARAAW